MCFSCWTAPRRRGGGLKKGVYRTGPNIKGKTKWKEYILQGEGWSVIVVQDPALLTRRLYRHLVAVVWVNFNQDVFFIFPPQNVFPEHYGSRFDTTLQVVVWEFLSRLEELLPVASFCEVSVRDNGGMTPGLVPGLSPGSPNGEADSDQSAVTKSVSSSSTSRSNTLFSGSRRKPQTTCTVLQESSSKWHTYNSLSKQSSNRSGGGVGDGGLAGRGRNTERSNKNWMRWIYMNCLGIHIFLCNIKTNAGQFMLPFILNKMLYSMVIECYWVQTETLFHHQIWKKGTYGY